MAKKPVNLDPARKLVSFRLPKETRDKLEALAKAWSGTSTAVIVLLVDEAHAKLKNK